MKKKKRLVKLLYFQPKCEQEEGLHFEMTNIHHGSFNHWQSRNEDLVASVNQNSAINVVKCACKTGFVSKTCKCVNCNVLRNLRCHNNKLCRNK